MSDEISGVIDGAKSYTHHALARVFGVADSKGRCSQFILNNMLREGLPFRKVGKFYVVSGHFFNLWIQEGSGQWPPLQERTADKTTQRKAGEATDEAAVTTYGCTAC